MSELDLYNLGLAFRRAVLDNEIPSDRYSSLLLDLCGHLEDLMPALSELSRRKTFKELPLQGTSAEMILARDKLTDEIVALYRHEVALKLIDLVEGVLGFVVLPEGHLDGTDGCLQDELISYSDDFHENNDQYIARPDEEDECYSFFDDSSSGTTRLSYYLQSSKLDDSTYIDEKAYGETLSLFAQARRTLLYQLPPFTLYLSEKIIRATQAENADFASLLNISNLVYAYINTIPWIWISFASVAFWAGLIQARQARRAPFRLELSIVVWYAVTLAIATPSLLAVVDKAYVADAYLGWTIISILNILAARLLMVPISRNLRLRRT